ncbi:hypothetical protein [Cohnella luojiensis]|uniref:Uncharacterized protein n=1 Tax=Cohnella luojiensis TaxID=652876 RepID=A0A4Y8M928_9BACL|nr:hypothetical protein [Cohnella luojiensis]TFE31645.1 hypothetical protein E2980_00775 [Cohnella luojiensis]
MKIKTGRKNERHRRKLAACRKTFHGSTQIRVHPRFFAQKSRTLMSTADLPEINLRRGGLDRFFTGYQCREEEARI